MKLSDARPDETQESERCQATRECQRAATWDVSGCDMRASVAATRKCQWTGGRGRAPRDTGVSVAGLLVDGDALDCPLLVAFGGRL
jgi:hypothetical protein